MLVSVGAPKPGHVLQLVTMIGRGSLNVYLRVIRHGDSVVGGDENESGDRGASSYSLLMWVITWEGGAEKGQTCQMWTGPRPRDPGRMTREMQGEGKQATTDAQLPTPSGNFR